MAPSARPGLELPERYVVLRHVADGGMASVWEARDEVLGRHVAVKVLSPAFADDDAARRRFGREARAAARLSTHPHVVTIYDTGEHDGRAFLVMALHTGGTVAERLREGPVPRPLALEWLRDAAGALDAAHAEGVVHRDVKPANLLLDAADRVAVADFGIATAAWETSVTSTGMVLGTMAYLAPEQRTGGVATPASDRYALGLVARELLTGAKPGVAPAECFALPGAAERALGRATAEDPAARPASCVALVAELETALGEEEPTVPTRVVASPRPRRPVVAVPAAGRQQEAPARSVPRPGAGARAVPGPEAAARAVPRPAAAARSAPRPAAAGPGRPPGASPPPGLPPRGSRRPAAVALLAALALLLGAGTAVVAGSGDDPGRPRSTTKAAMGTKATSGTKATPGTKAASSPSSSSPSSSSTASSPAAAATAPARPATTATTTAQAATPTAPTPTTQAPPASPASPAARKSRAQLVAQNNRAYAATGRGPAAQVPLLQEAVAGLCTDESDLNCAFALFNLAHALRLSGRAPEAVPLLERRLRISDNQVPAVRAELAAARASAAGG